LSEKRSVDNSLAKSAQGKSRDGSCGD